LPTTGGNSSEEERLLAMQKVAGSNPVSRSREASPSGKAGACKALIRRFESARLLQALSLPPS
jgi:hypothetical protein